MYLKKHVSNTIFVLIVGIILGGIFHLIKNNRHYLNLFSGYFKDNYHSSKIDLNYQSKLKLNNQRIKVPYIIITSDTHISVPEGRMPNTTGKFQNFLHELANNPPDLIFIVGDIIDNAINTPKGVTGGDNIHWNREVALYQSLINSFPSAQFLQTFGAGHDFGDLTLAEKKLGNRKGAFQWGKFQLIWFTVTTAAFSNNSVDYIDALPKNDYLWLREQLETSTNVILLFHVPLRTKETFEAGRWTNNTNLTIDYRDSLYKIIDQYSNKIVAIFNGHIHRPIQTRYHEIPLHICPFEGSGCHCVLTAQDKLLDVQYVDCPI